MAAWRGKKKMNKKPGQTIFVLKVTQWLYLHEPYFFDPAEIIMLRDSSTNVDMILN